MLYSFRFYYTQFKEFKILWGPGAEGRIWGPGARDRITQRPIIFTSEHIIMHHFLVSLLLNLNWQLYAERKDPNLRKYEP